MLCVERQTVRSASRLAASLIRLPRCYYYTTCKWCMESHLSSDAWPVLWLAALAAVPRVCCVRGCHALSLALRAVPWCLGCPACWCHGRCAVWVGCVPGALASWPALCWWTVCALCMGLPCGLSGWALFSGPLLWSPWRASEKALIFALYFSGIFSLDFLPLYAGLYFFLAYFSGFAKSNFFSGSFCVEISGEFFRIYFSGFFLALFSRRYLASSFFSM